MIRPFYCIDIMFANENTGFNDISHYLLVKWVNIRTVFLFERVIIWVIMTGTGLNLGDKNYSSEVSNSLRK